MDIVTLQILARELHADSAVVGDAAQKAEDRYAADWPGHLEACAFEIHRLYNVIERSLERVCEAFENHFERKGDYHERLLERMTLDLPGIRPPFLEASDRALLRELKSFRHLFRHAYDLHLDPEKLGRVLSLATTAAAAFPTWCDRFLVPVRTALEEAPKA